MSAGQPYARRRHSRVKSFVCIDEPLRFNRVDQDRLIARVAERVSDRRVRARS